MKTNNRRLRPLPPLPSSARLRPLVDCECGCGESTQRRFAPGHDSRLRGWVIRVVRGVCTIEWIREHVSPGEADAVLQAISERRLHGIDWSEIPEAAAEKIG